MRLFRSITVAAGLLFSVSCSITTKNPNAPGFSGTDKAELAFELWHGDPDCVSGCPGPPSSPTLLKAGTGSGIYDFAIERGHVYRLKTNTKYPEASGHVIKTITWTDATYGAHVNGPHVHEHESRSGDKSRGFSNSLQLTPGGTYNSRVNPNTAFTVRITVEDTVSSGTTTTTLELRLRL